MHVRELQVVPGELFEHELLNIHEYPKQYDLTKLDKNRTARVNMATKALTDFVRSLPALTDLHWACRSAVPLSIVEHLESSGCNLHLRDLYFEAYTSGKGDTVRLTHSKCLRSLRRRTSTWSLDGHRAFLRRLLTDAPRLSHVELDWRGDFEHRIVHPGPYSQAPPYYARTIADNARRGAIRTLQVAADGGKFDVEWWDTLSNLHELRSLKVLHGWPWHYASLNTSDLVNLEELTIRNANFGSENAGLVAFLARQSRLQRLDLYGKEFDCSSQSILTFSEAWGRNLRLLRCNDCFVNSDIFHSLLEGSPQLAHLGIGIYRHQGSRSEAMMYRALGGLPVLRVVELEIRSSQHSLWHEDGEEVLRAGFDGARLDQAYVAARDLAMDETLARSIFETISRSKGQFTPRLERVELDLVTSIKVRLIDPLRQFLYHIAVSQTCQGSIRDDCLHQCTVTARYRAHYGHDMAQLKVTRAWQQVPRLLWPESRRRHVSEVWRSFPIWQGDS